MTRRDRILSIVAWICVWLFWLISTRHFHPTFPLALVVTTSLTLAFATVVYLNHLVFIPRYWLRGHRIRYGTLLLGTMALLTGLALAVIRVSYFRMLGPDPDPFGIYKHFAIDFSGMAVHVGIAAIVVSIGKWRSG